MADLNQIISLLYKKCLSLIDHDEYGHLVISDPNDGFPVFGHYAISHFAAAAILDNDADSKTKSVGFRILEGLLDRWKNDSLLPDYHNDFNNFALCLIERKLRGCSEKAEYVTKIRNLVLATPDSEPRLPWHSTINWLPMRKFVNYCRYEWTGLSKYKRRVKKYNDLLKLANRKDGFIEDRLPVGTSFNLQYSIATLALEGLLSDLGYESIDTNLGLYAHLNTLSPDYDCNYLGRGCNQLFAWGPWLYLLKIQGQHIAFQKSLEYLSDRLPIALNNNNLLLNNLDGSKRQFWMDYHHFSVYAAHLLLWLIFVRQTPWRESDELVVSSRFEGPTGIKVFRGDKWFISIFIGRNHYCCEKGPVVSQIWTERYGAIIKGSFGPWVDGFGDLYSSSNVLDNYFGLVEVKNDIHRSPFFISPSVKEFSDKVQLIYRLKRKKLCLFNIPLIVEEACKGINIYADKKSLLLCKRSEIVNHYGRVALCQSSPVRAKEWLIDIYL